MLRFRLMGPVFIASIAVFIATAALGALLLVNVDASDESPILALATWLLFASFLSPIGLVAGMLGLALDRAWGRAAVGISLNGVVAVAAIGVWSG